ncbi:MAG: hypothetical protein XD87_0310 [candidate division WS6 bacterium 36_33]|uniref:Uncharacterized protein n=1 Tax=candidate division WS6 bacterium 36_33 TaxID=1641388 RepID=A0A101GYU1_9BACT|nr:MAG: hypothetical protein XD87_0310 [candidate division WS6 bacterium 36_33]
MKSPVKIILIIFAVLQLLAVLYLAVPAIPKKIKEQSPGSNYSSDKIFLSFNLSSDKYEINTEKDNSNDGRERISLKIPGDTKGVEITRIKDEKYIEVLNEKIKTLQNPFKARFAINTIRRDVKKRLLSGTVDERDFEDMKIKVYKGQDRRFIFAQIIFEDGHVDYTAEGNIGSYYYSIELVEESGPEDILKFMETATVIQN